jgi:threonylcarbamoyladenosine tRNA methylthiotransferase MtaB
MDYKVHKGLFPQLFNKIAFISFGCKVNHVETEELKQKLAIYQAELAKTPAEADIVVINSCAVTQKAADDVQHYIKSLRTGRPHLKVVLIGCAESDCGADLFIPNAQKQGLFEILELVEADKPQEAQSSDRTRAFVKVQDGCDSYCSYCIIPYLRGKPVSLPSALVEEKVKALLSAGQREIVLTGIHVGLYEEGLPYLLNRLGALEGDFRIRLSSLYPEDITPELLKAGKGKLCGYFHISLQSPNADILRRMGRSYTPEDFIRCVRQIKEAFPDAGIGADVITGFPGESEAQFQEGLGFLRESEIDYLHVFPYSPRPGTKAADYPDQIEPSEKKRRAAILRKLSEEMKTRGAERMLGKTLRVLAEQGGKGHADNFWLVKCPDTPAGEFVDIKITGHDKSLVLF